MMQRIAGFVLLMILLTVAVMGCEEQTAGVGGEPGAGLQPTGVDIETESPDERQPDEADIEPPEGLQAAEVVRVVDGDTLVVEIDGREERLRYIGVDTPETVRPGTPVECFGRKASAANENLVEGEIVYLEKDVSETDRYGRLLRYVYVEDAAGGELIFVNHELVEEGFAQVSTYPPDVRYEDDLLAAQAAAREEGRGLWGACQP